MKKKLRLFLSLSATLAAVIPIATVLSCGSQKNSNKNNDEGITKEIFTDQFFKDINDSIKFAGDPGSVLVKDNSILNSGLVNASLKYAQTSPGKDYPLEFVVDYHQFMNMVNGYTFWIVVTPDYSYTMAQGEQTILKINVQSSEISGTDSSTPAKNGVQTDEFFTKVENSITFSGRQEHVIVDDNALLNIGLANAILQFGISPDQSKPDKWKFDYHQLAYMSDGYTFWVSVSPKPGVSMGDGQKDMLTINVQSSTKINSKDFFYKVWSTIKFIKDPVSGYVSIAENAVLDARLEHTVLGYGWSSTDQGPSSYKPDYHQIKDMQDGYLFYILITPDDGYPMRPGDPLWAFTIVESS